MIYRMDSVQYMKFIKKEPIEAIIHTYYASIGDDVKTSGKLHPNVFNWSFVQPTARARIEADYDHELFKEIYYAELTPIVDERIAPIIHEILKKGERLIILYSVREHYQLYPQIFCRYLEERYGLSVYKYKEDELDRPYNVNDALHELKKRSKKAYTRKLIVQHPRSLKEDEVRYMLRLYGVKPVGDLEEMQDQLIELKREDIRRIKLGKRPL